MTKLRRRATQIAEWPRYVAFVSRVCGTRVAARMLLATLKHAPEIIRSGTLRSVDAELSRVAPPVRVAGEWTRWHRVDFGLFRDILLRRCYWPEDAFVPRAGDAVIDLGANVGAFSIVAAARMGAGRIIAVEAQPCEYDALISNIGLNGAAGIITPVLGFAGGDGVFSRDAQAVSVLDIGALLDEYRIREVALLKVDIEGSEFGLFGAPLPWLRRVRHISMEVHPPYGRVAAIAGVLRDAGFDVWTRDSATPDTAVYLYAARRPTQIGAKAA